ncbi:MAG: NAD(P)H-dependent oxidoreductase [Pseudomonadota bacterium]
MLLLISGSLRKDSFNTKLLHVVAGAYGGDSQLADLNQPLFNEDLEAELDGVPAEVQALSDQIKAAEAVVIASPEYNKNLTGVLKNALDWVSRTKGGPWKDKPVALVGASPGREGAARAMHSVVLAIKPFQPRLVTGPEIQIAMAHQEFADDGSLPNERYMDAIATLVARLKAETTR